MLMTKVKINCSVLDKHTICGSVCLSCSLLLFLRSLAVHADSLQVSVSKLTWLALLLIVSMVQLRPTCRHSVNSTGAAVVPPGKPLTLVNQILA